LTNGHAFDRFLAYVRAEAFNVLNTVNYSNPKPISLIEETSFDEDGWFMKTANGLRSDGVIPKT